MDLMECALAGQGQILKAGGINVSIARRDDSGPDDGTCARFVPHRMLSGMFPLLQGEMQMEKLRAFNQSMVCK